MTIFFIASKLCKVEGFFRSQIGHIYIYHEMIIINYKITICPTIIQNNSTQTGGISSVALALSQLHCS